MIKRIELKDFESHEHTVIEDLSEGLNLVCGDSNAGKCLTGDVVILDRDGSMRTILDMFRQGEWHVPSIRNGKFTFENASCVAANGDKNVFLLETRKGRRIKATDNHKFFTPYGWKELKDLKAGDWVAIARRIPVFGVERLPEGHARLIGYLLGDGGVINSLSFTNEEQDVIDDFKKLVIRLGDHHFIERPAGKARMILPSKPLSCVHRNIGASGLRTFCKDYELLGSKHNTKKIPNIVFTCCENDIKEIILGLMITDGWVSKRKGVESFEVGFCTTSEILSRQVSHLLTRFGIVSVVRRKKTSWKYLGKKKIGWAYSVDVHGRRSVCKFGEVFGYDFVGKKSELLRQAVEAHDMDRTICRYDGVPRTKEMIDMVRRAVRSSGKNLAQLRKEMGLGERTPLEGSCQNQTFGMTFLEKLARATKSRELRGVVESDLFWDRVKSVEDAGVEPTFDIEVPKTHTFIANDIYTHNTSIVRALKLVAYNQFDPRSVRVGATKCEVTVETERGKVKVTRGSKYNLWEITPVGKQTQYYDKVGKDVVPEASKIMGLNVVTLGDIQVPVNIMDQLESHFMLSGIGGKDASGSVRAQIVDEISGLSGIEGLIKSVSLDNHRFGREVKETEDKMVETRSQLHDENLLVQEEDVLTKAEEMLKNYQEYEESANLADQFLDQWNETATTAQGLQNDLDAIPDIDAAKSVLCAAELMMADAVKACDLYGEWFGVSESKKQMDVTIRTMPDIDKAMKYIGETEKNLKRMEGVIRIRQDYDVVEEQRCGAERRMAELDGVEKGLKALEQAKQAMDKAAKALVDLEQAREVSRQLKDKVEEMELCENQLAEAVKDRDAILAMVTTCPLTLKPVSKECLEGVVA